MRKRILRVFGFGLIFGLLFVLSHFTFWGKLVEKAYAQQTCVPGVDAVLLIDTSNSMSNGQMLGAEEGARQFVDYMKADGNNMLGLIQFRRRSRSYASNLRSVPPYASDMKTWITNLDSDKDNPPGTCIECAIRDAKSMLDSSPTGKKKVVILLSDGNANWYRDVDGSEQHDEQKARKQAKNAATALGTTGASLYTITIGRNPDVNEGLMEKLTENAGNGGINYQIKPPGLQEEIPPYYKTIWDLIRPGSILGRVFNDDPPDGFYGGGEAGLQGWNVELRDGNGGNLAFTTTNASGFYNFGNRCPANYQIEASDPDAAPPNYIRTLPFFSPFYTVFVPENTAVTRNFGFFSSPPPSTYNITGRVFVDTNRDGSPVGDSGFGGAKVTLSGDGTGERTTLVSGAYSFLALAPGTYTATLTLPPGYYFTTPLSVTRGLGPDQVINFGIARVFTISGVVFVDNNKNGIRDVGEDLYPGSVSVRISPATADGTQELPTSTFTFKNVFAGTYTVTYGPVPLGYELVAPPFATYIVRVGPGCSVTPSQFGGGCSGQNANNVNFAISDSIPWIQGRGLNIRSDAGFTSLVPLTTSCGGGPYALSRGSYSRPGILYTGANSAAFGAGQLSETRWHAGGNAFPETYTPPSTGMIRTSYAALLSSITRSGTAITPLTDLEGCEDLSDCRIPNEIESGVYLANGNVRLERFADNLPSSRQLVFLINGNLFIDDVIRNIPLGSTVIFSVFGDIRVDRNIGAGAPSCTPSSHLEGFFSADRNFIIDGNNNCLSGTDRMLHIQGIAIANAARRGGSFKQNRDLCGGNLQYPAVLLRERMDMVLNLPDYVRSANFSWREVAP